MGYIDVATAAKKWEVSDRSVRNYCQIGRVPGAVLDKGIWLIPDDAKKVYRLLYSCPIHNVFIWNTLCIG